MTTTTISTYLPSRNTVLAASVTAALGCATYVTWRYYFRRNTDAQETSDKQQQPPADADLLGGYTVSVVPKDELRVDTSLAEVVTDVEHERVHRVAVQRQSERETKGDADTSTDTPAPADTSTDTPTPTPDDMLYSTVINA